MLFKPIAIAVLAATCVIAAAGGAYLAISQNNQTDQAPAEVLALDEMKAAETAVEMTEAVVEIADSAAVPSPTQLGTASETSGQVEARTVDAEPNASTSAAARVEPARTERAEERPVAALPVIERWFGVDEERPTRGAVLQDEVGLTPVDTTGYGTVLEPESRPRVFEELVVSADSVVGLQIETAVTTETASVEDEVGARVTRDVLVGDQVAIPAGTRMLGSVVLVEPGGKVRARARLGIRFHTFVLADSAQLRVVTETVYREGESPAGESTAKIGGAAVAGAVLGAIFGGTRGAVLGGSAGAAGGTAVVMAGEANPATFPVGSMLTVRLSRAATVIIEQ